MKLDFKGFRKWVKAHIFMAAVWLFLFGFCAIRFGLYEDWRYGIAFVALIPFFYLNIWADMIPVVLALALLAMPAKAEEPEPIQAGAAAAGIVVVVVGGVVVVILIKTCQKLFPKDKHTNAPPELSLSGPEDSAASSFWFGGYCQETDVKSGDTLWLDGGRIVEPVGQEIIVSGTTVSNRTDIRLLTEKELTDLDGFRQQLQNAGLELAYGERYAVGGRPTAPDQCPIQFLPRNDSLSVPTVIVRGAGPTQTTVIERSPDLVTWTPLLTNTVPVGMSIEFTDRTTETKMFYRARNL